MRMIPISENTFGILYNSLFSHIHPLAEKYKGKCATRIQAGPDPARRLRRKIQPQNSRFSRQQPNNTLSRLLKN